MVQKFNISLNRADFCDIKLMPGKTFKSQDAKMLVQSGNLRMLVGGKEGGRDEHPFISRILAIPKVFLEFFYEQTPLQLKIIGNYWRATVGLSCPPPP